MENEVKTLETKQNKKKKKLKMPSALAIIVGVVIFAAVLTWIPHGAGDATEITIGDTVYQAGSLGAWQNWIIYNSLSSTYGNLGEFSSGDWIANFDTNEVQPIIDSYGLEGEWEPDVGFITDTSVPWTLSPYADGTTAMFGIFDTLKAMLGGYFMAWDVAFYLVGIYAVVLLLMETHTLRDGVSSLVKGLGGKELLLIPILFILFSLGGTLFGMQEETLGLIPVIVPVLILAGFDAATGMMLAILGTTTGIAASVLDPFSIGVMAAGLDVGIGTAVAERLLLFIIYTAVGTAFVTWYGARVRKNNQKSMDVENIEKNKKWAEEHIGDIHELEVMSKSQKWSLGIFGMIFAWMIFSLMPWTEWFPNLADSQGWLIFSSIFYGKVLLGEWYFVELAILFFVGAFIIGKLFKYESKRIVLIFWQALKEMFGVITIISFSRATSIILTSSGLTYGMIYSMVDIDHLQQVGIIPFALIWLFIFTLMSFFIPSTSGLAGVTAPIIGGVISATGEPGAPHTQLMIVSILMVYPLAQGCVNAFSPTTGLVVVQAEQSKVGFGKALPWLAGYAGMIFVVGIISIVSLLAIEVGTKL
ncbi:MAG: hypothetical protein TYPL_4320 [Candidatus Tyloplasma litorale]|nr:MAG: hypothetical protein TYPL_4320 [Mycoplasmatales bacterium]